jgi:membrane protease YdiL (CAAX protease family)
MVKNIFEEFAWRGYLASRLEHTPAGTRLKALITGWVWAGWHIPYYLYFLDRSALQSQTALSMPALIGLAFLIMPGQALLYNELRLISGSVWPAWLMHNAANALSFALVTGGSVAVSNRFVHVLLTPGTEGILYSLLAGLLGWYLHRRRVYLSADAS